MYGFYRLCSPGPLSGTYAFTRLTGGGLLTVTLNPQKTKSQLAVPSPFWAFVLGNLGKPKSRNEQRAVKWFSGFRGAYRTVEQELVGAVLAYLR